MQRLTGRIRPYAWGSRTALASLTGRPTPSAGPEAELWLGAHPDDPSALPGESLLDALTGDPAGLLGAGTVEEFGPRLPYLLKVLAAEAPLSIQAHPNSDQAREAFEAGRTGYTDPHHKPELLVALDDGFEALCGFRAPESSAEVLESLEVDALRPVIGALRAGSDPAAALRDGMRALMSWPAAERADLVDAVAAAKHPLATDLAGRYPGDIGVVVALLLNQVRLEPDEAVWMPAGNLHCYLRGLGVEIMAASDNVLRGGLTPKRVDVPELMRVLRFEVLEQPVVRPVPVRAGVSTWPAPVRDFVLHKASVRDDETVLPASGPRIVLCGRGSVELGTGTGTLPLSAGEAAFVGAGEPAVRVAGNGDAFQAGVA
ncbi:mannose-6-phosphate isomerase, class I [Rugosimonospora africana]|uniref:mannose-6-phosphate isomerase n=1 Tax=Rugosimonospora africana TaxID=556532 RepID=A0A8J3QJ89_9ACTN|nr:mannose-6-phosphate isomerase, class I [Rugosimonospora africana]GIH12014.1 putative mannose-6-phosphate isomerase ManA [Rugosimonospora africana]